MGRAGYGVSGCRTLGVPDLGPVYCLCVGPGPGPSGGQGHVWDICELAGGVVVGHLEQPSGPQQVGLSQAVPQTPQLERPPPPLGSARG